MNKAIHGFACNMVAVVLLAGTATVLTVAAARAQTEQPVIASARMVCDAFERKQVTLSRDAHYACATEEWPRINQDGENFRNVGAGAELNTLIRNLPYLGVANSAAVVGDTVN